MIQSSMELQTSIMEHHQKLTEDLFLPKFVYIN